MNIEKRISHEAAMYLRCKDMFDNIPQDKIEHIQSVVRKNYMSLDINIEFVSVELNDFEEVKRIYKENNILYISNLHNDSRLFPGDLNLAFRAWYDYIHLKYDLPFDYIGEYKTWLYHVADIQDTLCRQILYSEVVLQTAYYVTYNNFPKHQKIVLIDLPE